MYPSTYAYELEGARTTGMRLEDQQKRKSWHRQQQQQQQQQQPQLLQPTPPRPGTISARTRTAPSAILDNSNNSNSATLSSPAAAAAAAFESFPDRSNPTAARIIAMAQILRIDPTSEFYLLPIALHALEAPEEWVRVDGKSDGVDDSTDEVDGSDHYEKRRTDLDWFEHLAVKERARFRRTPAHAQAPDANSPWVKIQEPAGGAAGEAAAAAYAFAASAAPIAAAPSSSALPGRSYYYNFKTFRRATTMPPPSYNGSGGGGGSGEDDPSSQLHLPPVSAIAAMPVLPSPPRIGTTALVNGGRRPRPHHSELAVMSFTSWFTERGDHSSEGCDVPGSASSSRGRTRFVKIRFFMDAEEFEIEIMPPSASSASTSASLSATAIASAAAPSSTASFSTSGASAMALAAQCREAAANIAASKVYRIKSLKTKSGPASCWDLHLKATLNVFGRPTTLMQCDSLTREWLESNARRLLQVRSLLESKLARYQKIKENRTAQVPLVECHLRALMKDVARLKNALAAFRPSLADKYAL